MNEIIPDRKTTRLTDGKILLRPYVKKDAAELHRIVLESLDDIWPWLPFAHQGYSLKETKTWLNQGPKEWKTGRAYNFAVCDAATGEQVGGAGLNEINPMNKTANLGYWVKSDRTGQGIALTAAKLLAKWGFKALKLNRIEIHVAVDNARSLRVAEKAGAKREGVLRNKMLLDGKIHDSVMHSLLPGEI